MQDSYSSFRITRNYGTVAMVSIDIYGPYPYSRRQNRYLLTFVDNFSRYPEAIPISGQDAQTIARALVTQIFTRHGCPQVLSSDRGTNCLPFQELYTLLQIKRINSTSFNPKMQGKVEKFHAVLNQTMSNYVNKYSNDWDDFVDYALMVQQSTPHSITKFSPYLLHGREMSLPTTDDLSARVRIPCPEIPKRIMLVYLPKDYGKHTR
jgi:transposase InsO family protein